MLVTSTHDEGSGVPLEGQGLPVTATCWYFSLAFVPRLTARPETDARFDHVLESDYQDGDGQEIAVTSPWFSSQTPKMLQRGRPDKTSGYKKREVTI
ncbi:hypothetical protein ElyMa_000594500 [Elysia marginata]|uniref:Uncharacterized protein n=1 Tax=Elysia marginata TaxID=1093978 RepID=A0AAV4G916_9GAST|nr:hypothetical protein ElyMa_000594500 [Elysia marginata]